jgi:hypothetical protein
VKAFYKLGRVADARRLFLPMLESYAAGGFQGFCDNGMSKDWRDWRGGCHGYEGMLVDAYLPRRVVEDLADIPNVVGQVLVEMEAGGGVPAVENSRWL